MKSKIGLIIQREYLTRVRHKAFLIMTILGPVFIAGLMLASLWFSMGENQPQHLLVVDENYPLFEHLEESPDIHFAFHGGDLPSAKNEYKTQKELFTGILYLPSNIINGHKAMLYFERQPSAFMQRRIEKKVNAILTAHYIDLLVEEYKEAGKHLDKEVFARADPNFHLVPYKISEVGGDQEVDNSRAYVGLVAGVLIYIFIFMYGVQVMRGVIEEKTSRIIEVIISSVKPFELMMGKIVGIALVGLTQFLVWVVFSTILFALAQVVLFDTFYNPAMLEEVQMTTSMMNDLRKAGTESMNVMDPNLIINRINFPLMIGLFLFYFLGGYLLYSALFAAVGSAVDNETDTQQFMLPITLPLILAYMVSFSVISNPDGTLAFWFSIFPLTSPVVMLVRVAMGVGDGVAYWELILSMFLLVVAFLGAVWLAARIYKTGILMYGKKITWREMWKWIRYNQG